MELDYVKLREIKPALTGYVRKAESILKASEFPGEKAIHDVRVLMKKTRAVLHLINRQINDEFAERENQAFREVGRLMSSWRETSVIRKIIKDLRKEHPDIFSKLENNEKVNELFKKLEQNPGPVDTENKSLILIHEILNKTGYRIRFEPMNNLDPQLLLKELEITYNRVAHNYLLCRNNPKASSIHDLRKCVKEFIYQLWFFRPLNASVVKALEKKLEFIAQNLGKHHDLAIFIKMIGYKYEYVSNQAALDELVLVLRDRQEKYLSKVWPVAYKYFCPGQNLVNLLGFRVLLI